MVDFVEKKEKRKAEYRSSLRSKKLIQEATIALFQEKPVEKISVTDIVKRANLNRGTFYAHYSSPTDVFRQFGKNFIDNIMSFLADFEFTHFLQNPSPLLTRVGEFLQKDVKTYKLLVSSKASTEFVNQLKQIVVDYIRKDKSVPNEVKSNPCFDVALALYSGGIVNVFVNWVKGQLSMDMSIVVETMSLVLIQAAKPFLEKKTETQKN